MTKLRKELVAAKKKTIKPIKKEVRCGSDLEGAVCSTQTELMTKDVGCETKGFSSHPA
jgi:hypothetical protein